MCHWQQDGELHGVHRPATPLSLRASEQQGSGKRLPVRSQISRLLPVS